MNSTGTIKEKPGAGPRPTIQIGDRFGRWTVIGPASPEAYQRRWNCRCDCGTERIVAQRMLKKQSRSCGCLKREKLSARMKIQATTHGEAGRRNGTETIEYQIWTSMKNRCLNPNDPAFRNYGARGITICEEWQKSYRAFLRDVGRRPTPSHSIDRIDNDGPYAAGNVRWATPFEQGQNKRNNHILTYGGISQTLACWARSSGIHHTTIIYRLKAGWPLQQALMLPTGRRRCA